MADPAFLFDLDGTLVDSVYQHVLAWRQALEEAGIELSVWRIHRKIGMSGGLFANALLRETGRPVTSEEAERLQRLHSDAYASLASQVRPLPGSRALLSTLTALRVPWAIATSGRRVNAEPALEALGVPDGVPVITRDQVAHAKPDPDLFLAAASRLGVDITTSIVVGDSVWDLLAARRARALASGCFRVATASTNFRPRAPTAFTTTRRTCCVIWTRSVCARPSCLRYNRQSFREGEHAAMTGVRVLVGTRKGAFILTSDGKRQNWDVSGPHFAGWEMYHLKGSPVDPDRLYASQTSGWFGQIIQRSNDGGKTWEPVGNQFVYDGVPGTHQWYDGTPRPWEFKRVWHLEPSLSDPDTVYAGVEDGALFKSTDGAQSWQELSGLRCHGSGPSWQPGAGGLCLHTIIQDPSNAARMFIAISAAGTFRTDDYGKTWQPVNRGLKSEGIPDPNAEVGHCVHHVAMHPERPNVLYMQKHWDVMRSDDGADSWHEISGNLPTDFGFVIDVHAHEPETVYVIPIKSDSEHFVPDGMLRVYRSRTGGNEWEPLTKGLPQSDCYLNIYRDAMSVDSLDSCGIYFGTSGGQVYASSDAGDTWNAIVRDLPTVLSVEVQTLR